jgi:hypothetical protein
MVSVSLGFGLFGPEVITRDLRGIYQEAPGLKSETWGTLLCFPIRFLGGNVRHKRHMRHKPPCVPGHLDAVHR